MNLRLVLPFSAAPSSAFKTGDLIAESMNIPAKKWMATSGLAGYQSLSLCWTRGKGPIPPSNDILSAYKVQTNFHYSQKCKSNFYHIVPDPVVSIGDPLLVRKELGVHLDAGVPGSSGCIVFPSPAEFLAFENLMSYLRDQGQDYVDLIVEYI